ncbi:hypothetical protein BDW66DRAFT_139292 [Aspergillus desertorum]
MHLGRESQGRMIAATVHAILALASILKSGTMEQKKLQAGNYFKLAQEIKLLDILVY